MAVDGDMHASASIHDAVGRKDASRVPLDSAIPMKERPAYLMDALGDLNRFRVGEMGVTLSFADEAPRLETVLTGLLIRQRNGQ